MDEKIKITYAEVNNPGVDNWLQKQREESQIRSDIFSDKKLKEKLIHKSWFNLMIAGMAGALIAWLIIEPFFNETGEESSAANILLFPTVGGLIGLFLGCTEGILSRNFLKAMKSGGIGLLIGFFGGFVSMVVAGLIFSIVALLGFEVSGVKDPEMISKSVTFILFLILARSLGWTVAGMTVGLGPGIAIKSKKLVLNGFIGGMIGGAIGGLLFDPISFIVSGGTFETGGAVSRAIGFAFIGLSTGLMFGLVELFSKESWIHMISGPLNGKQFILYKAVTSVGSSPKCDVYLFKDPGIEPFHANIKFLRDGYEILDNNSADGIFVNGLKITKKRLNNGDEIKIGKTKFVYSEKTKVLKK